MKNKLLLHIIVIFTVVILCNVAVYYHLIGLSGLIGMAILITYFHTYQFIRVIDSIDEIQTLQINNRKINEELKERHKALLEYETLQKFTATQEESQHLLQCQLKRTVEYNQHFSNIISGINHEISPWLGSISNVAGRVQTNLLKPDYDRIKLAEKLDDIKDACEQTISVLHILSQDVKKVKDYSIDEYNLKETIQSYVKLVLMDRTIKESIDSNAIVVNYESLDFNIKHSPLLLSQIILNLARNTIEHNQHKLDDIIIKIYGLDNGILIYEDNGKGISQEVLPNLFTPGITTKDDKSHHGFGLAACQDYAHTMKAMISVESEVNTYTRFIIEFDMESESDLRRVTGGFRAIK